MYDIQLGDVVHFQLDDEDEMDAELDQEVEDDDNQEFNYIKVTVYSEVESMKKAKHMTANPGMITT